MSTKTVLHHSTRIVLSIARRNEPISGHQKTIFKHWLSFLLVMFTFWWRRNWLRDRLRELFLVTLTWQKWRRTRYMSGLFEVIFIGNGEVITSQWTLSYFSCIDLGWGLLKLRSLISPLQKISIYHNSRSHTLNHVNIWQVSPQLSCGDSCQIWTSYFIVNVCFDSAENVEI